MTMTSLKTLTMCKISDVVVDGVEFKDVEIASVTLK
jgi:hypothetical protein